MIRKLGRKYRAFNFTDLLPILYAVSGSANDIEIYAVFVSWVTGQALLGAVGDKNTTCTLQPAFQNTAWSIMAVSFISLLAVSAILATFFFVRRHRLRHFRLLAMEPSGMNAREVQALPTFIFKGCGDRGGTAETCAICLEDYESGEKLRLLPCHHEFHVGCIDQWLVTRRPFCPVCKQDAHMTPSEPAASETTPLLVAAVGRALSVPLTTSATQTSPLSSPTTIQTTQSLPANVYDGLHNTERGEELC
jgi:E3 ubiquitin-protein ligase RNF13